MKKIIILMSYIFFLFLNHVFANTGSYDYYVLKNNKTGEYKQILVDYSSNEKKSLMVNLVSSELKNKVPPINNYLENRDYVAQETYLPNVYKVRKGNVSLLDIGMKYAEFTSNDFVVKDYLYIYFLGFMVIILFYLCFFGITNLFLHKSSIKERLYKSLILNILGYFVFFIIFKTYFTNQDFFSSESFPYILLLGFIFIGIGLYFLVKDLVLKRLKANA